MTVAPPTLFIGDANREEFCDAAKSLIERGAVLVESIDAALAAIHQGFAPALIVIAQTSPGDFSADQIDQLRRAAPLARIVRLLGTWLDGDGRTGRPWPATIRANWQRWDARHGAERFGWCMPVTASEDDRLLAAADAAHLPVTTPDLALAIAVHAPTRESAESLIDCFSQRGWIAIWLCDVKLPPSANINCIVFDARNNSDHDTEALANLKRSLGEVPIIALVGFPRIEDLKRFQAAGASAVVAKPYLADDLLRQIEWLCPPAVAQ